MKNIELFRTELDYIKNVEYKSFMETYLQEYVPNYFWEIGASSSGNFHPQMSQGIGGLVRHTKAVARMAYELLSVNSFGYITDEQKDYVIMACLAHDTCKYGAKEYDKAEYPNHERNAAKNLEKAWLEYFEEPAPYLLTNAIKTHMGQWCTHKDEDKAYTPLDRCVHLADYVVSRNFIDIPAVSAEYSALTEELPF